MALITSSAHLHICPDPACGKRWSHHTRSCSADAELPCPEHPTTPEPPPPTRPAEVWMTKPIDDAWKRD